MKTALQRGSDCSYGKEAPRSWLCAVHRSRWGPLATGIRIRRMATPGLALPPISWAALAPSSVRSPSGSPAFPEQARLGMLGTRPSAAAGPCMAPSAQRLAPRRTPLSGGGSLSQLTQMGRTAMLSSIRRVGAMLHLNITICCRGAPRTTGHPSGTSRRHRQPAHRILSAASMRMAMSRICIPACGHVQAIL